MDFLLCKGRVPLIPNAVQGSAGLLFNVLLTIKDVCCAASFEQVTSSVLKAITPTVTIKSLETAFAGPADRLRGFREPSLPVCTDGRL